MTVPDAVRSEEAPPVSVDALAADEAGEELPPIGEEDPEDIPRAADLFNPATTARVVLMQNLVPAIATAGAYLTFRFLPIAGV